MRKIVSRKQTRDECKVTSGEILCSQYLDNGSVEVFEKKIFKDLFTATPVTKILISCFDLLQCVQY